MRKIVVFAVALFAVALVFTACGGGGASESGEAAGGVQPRAASGDAARGEALYLQTIIGSAGAPGCVTCHSLEEGVSLVGPSHAGLAARAETAVDGASAAVYLEDSIREPDKHITEGFTEGVMYQTYANDLDDQEIKDLVAFLLTQ